GKEIFTDIANKYSGDYIKELDTSKFSKGIYTVQAIIGDEIIVKKFILKNWQKKLPAWTEMVMGTRVLSLHTMTGLFPEAKFLIERKFFIPKSIIAVKKR
ncbi:MAG: hypothetical protein IID51_14450, partial [Proteobacteria bacterium]|nr:hypothetical protein [Pseudomonadota bacterium]